MLVELSVVEQRYHAVMEVAAGVPVTQVAARYGVSRQSVHSWVRKYKQSVCRVWPALASAGIIPAPEKGKRYVAAREHGMHALRHFYASVLLDAGESIKALSLYLGHSDPGFTLRVYTHLMPSSETRTRKAISAMYRAAGHAHDGPETAQAA